jgi:pyruvate,water dikinase
MLIHGAIIAREYGIPCVTGIADATSLIASGDRLTLDGYLGIVFFPSPSGRMAPDRETGARRDGNDVSRQPAGPTLGKAEQK